MELLSLILQLPRCQFREHVVRAQSLADGCRLDWLWSRPRRIPDARASLYPWVRVGMENTVYVDRGRLTSGNAELVEKACWLIAKLGGEIAKSEEARSMLALH